MYVSLAPHTNTSAVASHTRADGATLGVHMGIANATAGGITLQYGSYTLELFSARENAKTTTVAARSAKSTTFHGTAHPIHRETPTAATSARTYATVTNTNEVVREKRGAVSLMIDRRSYDRARSTMHSKATHTASASTLAVLVGGEGRRMGGVAKGALPSRTPGETLLDRTLRVAREAGFTRCVLVGRAEKLAPYERYTLESINDRPDLAGPLAGLAALCAHERAPFVMVACDMPALDPVVLARLREGHPSASVLAPRDARSLRWEPTLAWYHPERVRAALDRAIAAGQRSFQSAFSAMDCVEFVLTAPERASLEDWDTPEDRAR